MYIYEYVYISASVALQQISSNDADNGKDYTTVIKMHTYIDMYICIHIRIHVCVYIFLYKCMFLDNIISGREISLILFFDHYQLYPMNRLFF
jgi:hypothetical protein